MPSRTSEIDDTLERPGRGRGVQSVEVAVGVLAALARNGGPMTLKHLSAAVGMPPAKAHRYLASFVDAGMVEHRRSGSYDLGPLAMEIGVAAMARADFVNRTADRLEELVDSTGATALLSVWGNKGPTVVRWQRASLELTTTLGLGSVLPPTRTATGHVFLAFTPKHLVGGLIDEALALPDAGVSRRKLDTIIRRVRREGHAWVDQTFIPGLYAVSAPVLNWQSEIEAAITLISREARLIEPSGPELTALKTVTQSLAVGETGGLQ